MEGCNPAASEDFYLVVQMRRLILVFPVAYLCTEGIAVLWITCFIVHCHYFLCDVAGVAHRITLRFRERRHLCLLFITSQRSRDGKTLMLIHDKDYFVLVLTYYTKLFTKTLGTLWKGGGGGGGGGHCLTTETLELSEK